MARMKRIKSKSTKIQTRKPQQFVTCESRGAKKFLKEFGMPSLLWRVLHSVGYATGKEPRYQWSKDLESQRPSLLPVEVVIPAKSEGVSLWCGRRFIARGRNPQEGANIVAYKALRDLLKRCPDEVARATAGVFPKGDPYHAVWRQIGETALVGGTDEAENSNSIASSAMFAMMKSYSCLENALESLHNDYRYVTSDRREAQRVYTEDIARVTKMFEEMTLSKDQALQQENAAMHETFVVQSQFLELSAILGQWQEAFGIVAQQRNEAWNEEYRLREWVHVLMTENAALNAEIQRIYNQHPHNPPGVIDPEGAQVVPNIVIVDARNAVSTEGMDHD